MLLFSNPRGEILAEPKQSDLDANNSIILTNEIALKGFVKFDISIQSKDENSKVLFFFSNF